MAKKKGSDTIPLANTVGTHTSNDMKKPNSEKKITNN